MTVKLGNTMDSKRLALCALTGRWLDISTKSKRMHAYLIGVTLDGMAILRYEAPVPLATIENVTLVRA